MLAAVPHSFNEKLRKELGGRLRLRVASQSPHYLLEQKVGTRFWEEALRELGDHFDPERDDHTQMRDGYWLIARITGGDRMPCPGECGSTLRVPLRHFAEVTCEKCREAKRDGRYLAGFFQPDDHLLRYVREILTTVDAETAEEDAAAANAARHERLLNETVDDVTAGLGEYRRRMNDNLLLGWTP